MRSGRPSRPWITIFMIALGFIGPIMTYHLDGLLRFDLGIFVSSDHWMTGVIRVLRIQARNEPVTLIPLVGAPIAALGFVIVSRTLRCMRERPEGRRGIGGWLALFVLSIVLGTIINVRGLYASRDAIFESILALPHLGQATSPALVLLILARNLVVVVVTLASIAGLWLIIHRSHRAPGYWTILCAVLAPVQVYHGAIGAWERTVAARVQINLFPNAVFGLTALVSAVTSLAWCAYWLLSRRVGATFGERGVELFVDREAVSGIPVTSTTEEPPG